MSDEGEGGSDAGPLTCRADAFSLPDDLHYLNCAYMSPLARAVERAGLEGFRRLRDPTRIEPSDFFGESDDLRRAFARLVRADDPDRVAIVPSVSYGVALAAKNLEVEAGQNLVLAEDQFPSNVYAWHRLAGERGLEVRTVGPGDEPNSRQDGQGGGPGRAERWNERLLEAVDGATAAAALPHVHWTDGTRFDLEAVGRRCREAGAALVVDGTQSVGALPFDVGRIRPDALVCAGYKWMLGPYSIGTTYLGPRFDDADPLEETWLGRKGSEDFGGLVDYEDEYQPGASRHDMGERSNPVTVPMQTAGIRLLLDWRVERIQAYCRDLIRPLIEEAAGLGMSVEEGEWRSSHLFGLRLPAGARPEELAGHLRREDVVVSVRGDALRVSPHLYNDRGDVEALLEVLRRLYG